MRSLQRHDVILKLPSDINESMLTFLTCFDILLIDSTKLINCNVILRRDLDKCILVAVSLTEMLIVKLRNIGKTWRVTTDDAIGFLSLSLTFLNLILAASKNIILLFRMFSSENPRIILTISID